MSANVANGSVAAKQVRIGNEVFVRCWMKHYKDNGCIDAVASELGLKPTSAYQRWRNLNAKLKEKGVTELPSMPQSATRKNRSDYSAIGDLVNELSS